MKTYYATVTLRLDETEVLQAVEQYEKEHPFHNLSKSGLLIASVGLDLQTYAYDEGNMNGQFQVEHVKEFNSKGTQ